MGEKRKKEKDLTQKIRSIMEEIKHQAHLEEKKNERKRSYSIHPDHGGKNQSQKKTSFD